jgi:hypothetical protein
VEGYLGSFYKPPNSPTDVYLPAIDCDKALIAKLSIMEKLNPSNEVRCSQTFSAMAAALRNWRLLRMGLDAVTPCKGLCA